MKFILVSVCIFILIKQNGALCPNKTYPTLRLAFQAMDTCTLATNNFNTDCVSTGCPLLRSTGLCPYSSDGKLNFTAIKQNLAIATACFQQQKPICNTPLDPIPITPYGFGLLNVLDPLPLNVTLQLRDDVCRIQDLSNTNCTLISNESNTDLLVDCSNPNYGYLGALKLIFTFGGINGTLMEPQNFIIFDYIPGQMNFSINVISKIILNPKSPSFQVQQISATAKVVLSAFQFTDLLELLNIHDLVENAIAYLAESSDIPNASANFFSTFIMYALQVTTQNCQKTKING